MPRTWVRKTDRGVDAKILKRAAEELTMEHLSGQWQKSMASAMLRLIDIGRSLNFFQYLLSVTWQMPCFFATALTDVPLLTPLLLFLISWHLLHDQSSSPMF